MNQSAFESRMVRGIKYSSTCRSDNCSQILLRDSTACFSQNCIKRHISFPFHTLSLTRGSSIAARFSRGAKRQWPCSGPPTYSMKFPSSSANAVKTSSSSSTESGSGSVLEHQSRRREQTIQKWYQLISCSFRTQS